MRKVLEQGEVGTCDCSMRRLGWSDGVWRMRKEPWTGMKRKRETVLRRWRESESNLEVAKKVE